MKTKQQILLRPVLIVAAVVLVAASAQRVLADGFTQTNLVSDIPGLAATTDPNLVNPWGVSFSPGSPFWVSDNGTGVATLYNGDGSIVPLVVTVPPSLGAFLPSGPTGQVFNSSSSFNSDVFIFATEGGTIAGWRGSLGTTAETLYPGTDSVYKGLAIGTTPNGTYLYATDFHNNSITVVPGTGAPALPGTFIDPNLPAGYAPFNIQNIGGKLYVTYAVQDAAKHDDVAGPGHGIVDVFDLQGNFIQRLISNGLLNSPWGMAIAPTGFGNFGGDLLVGNFGDGTINAFDPSTGTFLGQLDGANGTPLINLGLWDLSFGNGAHGFSTDALYFTAGIPGDGQVEDHGLFGSVTATGSVTSTPEPSSVALMLLGLGLVFVLRKRVGQGLPTG
jgi:uncharacterized protein (TIGR03118 family)